MLVLTRKVGEGIAIGDDVKIVVMQIKGKQVRLGIKASATTSVHREEIYQKIQDENRAASSPRRESLTDAAAGMADVLGVGGRDVGQAPLKKSVKGPRGNAGE